ncbi:family 43 glycosylhydrolase [Microbacterium hydrocarbonoxydans]|uniref:family 43 glycosylhydrolase n=1 Tax=Microbacterium hydrocarbonoxydans TaxID=273678 RepID=UPI003D951AFF
MTDRAGINVFCNPLDLAYRYQDFARGPLRAVFREAADPSVVRFQDHFYMFASMSGGFWHSADLRQWHFAATPDLPAGDYAPDVREVDGALIVTASRRKPGSPIFRSRDPLGQGFEQISESAFAWWDPNLFQDLDSRTYLYWGCSNKEPLRGVEVSPDSLHPLGEPIDVLSGDISAYGWERNGENNRMAPPMTLGEKFSAKAFGTHSPSPYLEGAWMTRHKDTYYFQYAGPGTEYNVYADGYYTAPSALGPFTPSPHNPFSSKPGGFITGAGHGSTFQDAYGNWWHAATMRISVSHRFERRLGIFPAGFDDDGVLFCNQTFGDYPTAVPDGPADPWAASTGWMLQSYRARVTASSAAVGHGPELAVDEDVRTWWVAGDESPGETLTLDLEQPREVYAIQINTADHQLARRKPRRPRRGPDEQPVALRAVHPQDHPVRYTLEASVDGEAWSMLHDGRTDASDRPHRLLVLEHPQQVRFVRITGVSSPWNAPLALSGVRVFGHHTVPAPPRAEATVRRTGPLDAEVTWKAVPEADGYNVRYGLRPDRLYHSWQVLAAESITLSTLTAGEEYWVVVDSYGPGGVTPGEPMHLSRDTSGAIPAGS